MQKPQVLLSGGGLGAQAGFSIYLFILYNKKRNLPRVNPPPKNN
jgi:hypothetical protein